MPEPSLHHLKGQLEPAVHPAVDAPRGVEVAQRMEALVFRPAMLIDDAGGNLRRMKSKPNDRVAMLDAAAAVGKYYVPIAPWTGEPVLAQCGDDHRRQRHRALACLRLRAPDRAVPIGALADMQLAAFQIYVMPAQAAQLRGAQPGEDEQQRPVAPGRGVELADGSE